MKTYSSGSNSKALTTSSSGTGLSSSLQIFWYPIGLSWACGTSRKWSLCSAIALYICTGTLTSPKLIAPLQIARATFFFCPAAWQEKRHSSGKSAGHPLKQSPVRSSSFPRARAHDGTRPQRVAGDRGEDATQRRYLYLGNFLDEGNVARRAHGPDRDSEHRLHLPLRPVASGKG